MICQLMIKYRTDVKCVVCGCIEESAIQYAEMTVDSVDDISAHLNKTLTTTPSNSIPVGWTSNGAKDFKCNKC